MRFLPVALVALALLPAAAAELQWTAPATGVVGSPVQAAWADVVQESPRTLGAHVETRVKILEGDAVVFESGSIHEHDGFHALAWTPTRPGPLTLQVTPADGSPAEHTVQVEAAPAATLEQLAAFQGATLDRDGHWLLSEAPSVPVYSRWDLRDDAGRLLLSSAAVHAGNSAQGPDTGTLGGALRALATSGGGPALGVLALEAPVQAADGPLATLTLTPPQTPACTDLVTDPDSATPDQPTWQRWSDVRVSVAQPDAVVVYTLVDRTLPVGQRPLWTAVSSAPHATLAFRAPGPGAYGLLLGGDVECQFAFRVVDSEGVPLDLPGAGTEPGTVEAEIVIDGNAATVAMVPLGADGTALSHYEFDTRVLQLGVPGGRLVWQGKLHGHAGAVEFTLGGLAPGDYLVQTYPSPQDLGTAPVATDDPAGFVYAFHVEGPAADGAQPTPTAAVPGVSALLLAVTLLATVALRRR